MERGPLDELPTHEVDGYDRAVRFLFNPDVDQKIAGAALRGIGVGVVSGAIGIGLWVTAASYAWVGGRVALGIAGALFLALGVFLACAAPGEMRAAGKVKPARRARLEQALATLPPEPMLLRVTHEILRYNWDRTALSSVPYEDWEYCASLYRPGATLADDPVEQYLMPATHWSAGTTNKGAYLVDPVGDTAAPLWALVDPPTLHPVTVYRLPAVGRTARPRILVDMGGPVRFLSVTPWEPSRTTSALDALQESSAKWQL